MNTDQERIEEAVAMANTTSWILNKFQARMNGLPLTEEQLEALESVSVAMSAMEAAFYK